MCIGRYERCRSIAAASQVAKIVVSNLSRGLRPKKFARLLDSKTSMNIFVSRRKPFRFTVWGPRRTGRRPVFSFLIKAIIFYSHVWEMLVVQSKVHDSLRIPEMSV